MGKYGTSIPGTQGRDDPNDEDRNDAIAERLMQCPYCDEVELPSGGGECNACHRETYFVPANMERFDEPAECLDCGLRVDASALKKCSLDAYAGPDDYDLLCPLCEGNHIRLYRPKEDR